MKNHYWAASTAAVMTIGFAMPSAHAQNDKSLPTTIPAIPVALFSASPSVVQTGTYPTLSWSILYPSKVSDVAAITPPGTITLTTPMYVSVRPVGVGVTGSTSGVDKDLLPAEIRISVNGSSYQQLFYGTDADVEPSYSLYIKKLQPGTTVDFGGRYVDGGAWTPFYTTRSGNHQVISLVDGDSVPTSFDLVKSGKLAEHLKPYIDGNGKVKIGPLSVLVLMELASSSNNPEFDYQDFAALVSFASKHPNNGHGNNLDGVDSSNPGAGSGGPNGAIDPSGGVDDEMR